MNKRQLQYQATRDALYAAVNSLVEEMDFDSIRIQDICARAGISLGTFYHYFQNKEDLLIDRYLRTNQYFAALYRTHIQTMHPVDGLKLLLEELAHYTNTRLPDVLVPYYVALVKNSPKWDQKEANALFVITQAIVKNGISAGQLNSRYTGEEILHFLSILYRGIVSSQCITRGAFLQEDTALTAALDWVEALRNIT